MVKLLMVPLASANLLVDWYCAFTCPKQPKEPKSSSLRHGCQQAIGQERHRGACTWQLPDWVPRLIQSEMFAGWKQSHVST